MIQYCFDPIHSRNIYDKQNEQRINYNYFAIPINFLTKKAEIGKLGKMQSK